MSSNSETDRPIAVLIADDHPVVRGGLSALLAKDPGIQVVAEASDGLEAIDKALKHRPDVILMDLSMPRCDGTKSTIAIKKQLPNVKVLILTVSEDENDIILAIRSGADGYILKNTDMTEIVDSIKRVHAGEAALTPRIAEDVLKALAQKEGYAALSSREREILGLIGKGLTAPEIARRLVLSVGSIITQCIK